VSGSGRVGGYESGRSSAAIRRVNRQGSPSLQAQGSDGKHHWRSEAPLLLSEAGRKAPGEASFGAKACSKEDSRRAGLDCNHRGRCCRAAAFYFAGQSFFVTRCICPLEGPRPTEVRARFAKIAKYKSSSAAANPLRDTSSHCMQHTPACE